MFIIAKPWHILVFSMAGFLFFYFAGTKQNPSTR